MATCIRRVAARLIHHTGLCSMTLSGEVSVYKSPMFLPKQYMAIPDSLPLLSHLNHFSNIIWQSTQTRFSMFEPILIVVGTLNFPMTRYSSPQLDRYHIHKAITYLVTNIILNSKMQSAVQCRIISTFPCPCISATQCDGHRILGAKILTFLRMTRHVAVSALI